MRDAIPAAAVGASVGVLIYSLICLILCTLVVGMLFKHGEKWTYITLLATFSALSTFVSMIQQIHYSMHWRTNKEAQYQMALYSENIKGLIFLGAAGYTQAILATTDFYCYHVMSLAVLCWAVNLFCGAWDISGNFLGKHIDKLRPASLIFAILWPALIMGICSIPAITHIAILFYILSLITLYVSLSTGVILLILILYKYMKIRRLVMGKSSARRVELWSSSGGDSHNQIMESGTEDLWTSSGGDAAVHTQIMEFGTGQSGATSDKRQPLYDRGLLTRFTIGFTILAGFGVLLISNYKYQVLRHNKLLANKGPDLEVRSTISDILLFIPGVTPSLVVYLVFGTTKPCKQYIELIRGCCGLRKKIQHKENSVSDEPQAMEEIHD